MARSAWNCSLKSQEAPFHRVEPPMRWTIPGAAFLAFVGCGGAETAQPETPTSDGQSLVQAVSLMCRADTLSGAAAEEDPLDRSAKRDQWLSDNVKNPDAIYFRTIARTRAPKEHAALLREQAAELGVRLCPEADRIENDEL